MTINNLFIIGAKYLYLFIVVIFIFYFSKQTPRTKKEIAIFSTFVLPVSYLVAKLTALFFYNPRPFVVNKFIPLIYHIPDNGFPSDHTLLSASLAFIVFSFNRKLGTFLLILALIVGISRVFVGVHHFIDILGSLIISGLVVFFASHFFVFQKKERKTS